MKQFNEVEAVLIWQPKPDLYPQFSCCFGRCREDAAVVVDEKRWKPTKRTWITEQKGYCKKHGPVEHCPSEWFKKIT